MALITKEIHAERNDFSGYGRNSELGVIFYMDVFPELLDIISCVRESVTFGEDSIRSENK